MPKYCLIDKNKRVVHEFDAVGPGAARTAAGNWCSLNVKAVVLCEKIKGYRPVQAPTPPVVEEADPT